MPCRRGDPGRSPGEAPLWYVAMDRSHGPHDTPCCQGGWNVLVGVDEQCHLSSSLCWEVRMQGTKAPATGPCTQGPVAASVTDAPISYTISLMGHLWLPFPPWAESSGQGGPVSVGSRDPRLALPGAGP